MYLEGGFFLLVKDFCKVWSLIFDGFWSIKVDFNRVELNLFTQVAHFGGASVSDCCFLLCT